MLLSVLKVETYKRNLEKLSSPDPYRDNYHVGIEGNNTCIELEYGRLFRRYVLDMKPDLIVEIGTGWGYSTAWFMLGLMENKKGKIITIDEHENMPLVWEELGWPEKYVEFVIGSWKDVSSIVPGNIDLAFHDANHRIENVVFDMGLLIPKMSKGGRILIHDTNYCRGMGDQLREYFNKKRGWDYDEIKASCGVGIADKKGDKGK